MEKEILKENEMLVKKSEYDSQSIIQQFNIMEAIKVKGFDVRLKQINEQDYISLTDIANHFGNNKDPEGARFLISNWMRNRDIFDYLG